MKLDIKAFAQWQVPRTLLVGGLATLIDYWTMVIWVKAFDVSPQVANVPCLILGSMVQFFGNRHFVFKAGEGVLSYQVIGFLLTEIGALALNAFLFYALVEYTAMSYLIARPLASALTFFCFSFPLWRKVFEASALRNKNS